MEGLRIHQIWYRDEQWPHLDPEMYYWDNRANLRPEWCEYWVMRQAALQFEENFSDLTGFFSWKYKEKLGVDYGQISGFIAANPGMDCYILSPAVFQVAAYVNVWQQGEIWHPGITDSAQSLLNRLGFEVNIDLMVDHHLTTAYSNYWVGSRRFWREYLSFMDKVFNEIESQKTLVDSPFWDVVFGSAGGDGHVQALPVIPYVVERLFSVFVRLHPEFRVVAWEYPFDVLQSRAFGAAGLIPIANWCKLMFCETGDIEYMRIFSGIQARMFEVAQNVLSDDSGRTIR